MNKLVTALENRSNLALTGNGAKSFASTKSTVLDWFYMSGATRKWSDAQIQDLFDKAFGENPNLALKAMLFTRDARGGYGERRAFRQAFRRLIDIDSDLAVRILPYVAEFGRWDDVVSFLDTRIGLNVAGVLAEQYAQDMLGMNASKHISLLAKWLPSENASSAKTKKLARDFIKYLKLSPREYRKALSELRGYLNVLERSLSSGEWAAINYEAVPSNASLKYRKAFGKHDAERYGAYLKSVQRGDAKINTSVLFPADIVTQYGIYGVGPLDQTLETAWKALPDYLDKNPHNGLVVCDVSGSMRGTPMSVAVSLAIYFAQRNQGDFAGKFLSFTDESSFVDISNCATLKSAIETTMRAPWGMSTNLQSALDLILTTAIANRVPVKDMPTVLYVVSDMQFNKCCRGNTFTNFEAMQVKYDVAGYPMPQVVFWNVKAADRETPVTKDEFGVTLVSGYSASIFRQVVEQTTPYEFMVKALSADRYGIVDKIMG